MMDRSCMKINLLEKVEKATRKRYIWTKDPFRLLPNRKDSKIRHRYNGLIPKIPTLAQAPQGPAKSHGVDVECYVITT